MIDIMFIKGIKEFQQRDLFPLSTSHTKDADPNSNTSSPRETEKSGAMKIWRMKISFCAVYDAWTLFMISELSACFAFRGVMDFEFLRFWVAMVCSGIWCI